MVIMKSGKWSWLSCSHIMLYWWCPPSRTKLEERGTAAAVSPLPVFVYVEPRKPSSETWIHLCGTSYLRVELFIYWPLLIGHNSYKKLKTFLKNTHAQTIYTSKQTLMMAYKRSESARENFGKFIDEFQPKTKTLVRKLERILIKLCRQIFSV